MTTNNSTSDRFSDFAHEVLTTAGCADATFVRFLDMTASITTESLYVINLEHRQFCYISPNASFLCGHSIEEALKLGYNLYPKIIYPKDLELAKKIYSVLLQHLNHIKDKKDEICYFSHTLRFQQKYSFLSKPLPQMVYHRIKPVWTNDKLHYFICSVGCSVVKEPGHARIYYKDGLSYDEYNFNTKRWKQMTVESLTENDRAILMLARQGKSAKEISDILYLGYQTIRNRLTALFERFDVNSMLEATIYATNRRMIFGRNHEL